MPLLKVVVALAIDVDGQVVIWTATEGSPCCANRSLRQLPLAGEQPADILYGRWRMQLDRLASVPVK
jgi:hypothetical protein